MLTGNQEISYSRELAILGLREVMGNRFLEYPKQSILYTSVDSKTKARAYGHGFTYAGKLSDLDEHKHMSEASVKQQIENGEFDAVVFGKIGVWDDGVLNSPFWVKKALLFTSKTLGLLLLIDFYFSIPSPV